MVTDPNQTYCGDHFEMCGDVESLCCTPASDMVLQVSYISETNKQQTHKLIEKEIRFVVIRGRGLGEGLDEGGQQVQTSSYKKNKYQGCTVQHDEYN